MCFLKLHKPSCFLIDFFLSQVLRFEVESPTTHHQPPKGFSFQRKCDARGSFALSLIVRPQGGQQISKQRRAAGRLAGVVSV